MGERALLIVDLQQDFIPGGALAVSKGDEIIPLINRLQREFDHVLATKDWHPPGHISFASRHKMRVGERIEVDGLEQILWPDHCVQGSQGAEFVVGLETEKIQKVFFKGIHPDIDSYSTFFDNAHKRSTGLQSYLNSLQIDEIFIAGLATDYCVKYSVLDARKLGFKTYVIIDGCRGIDLKEGDIERAIAEMEEVGAQIISSSYILPHTFPS